MANRESDQLAVDALGADVPRVTVVRYWPSAWFWRIAPFVLLALFYVAYELGYAGGVSSISGESPLPRLGRSANVAELRAELDALRLAREVDGAASQETRANIQGLQTQIATLEEEVAFYRSIMAPEEQDKGLHIERVVLKPTRLDRVYRYELVIAQRAVSHSWQTGDIYFELHGNDGATRRVLALTEMAELENYPLEFRLRYFQRFAGELTLPEDFLPETVIVTLDGERSDIIEQREYPWVG
ncbi:MAG: DUF6776 family protein [Pseudomonadota bacterium]